MPFWGCEKQAQPSKWHTSFANTIGTLAHGEKMLNSRLAPMMKEMIPFMARQFGMQGPPRDEGPRFPPKEALIAAFLRHNDEVRRTIAPERLLEFQISEGWEPLCAFLDRPVPDAPFPRVNDTAMFHTFDISRG